MRRLISLLFLLVITEPLSADPASLWTHNGSTIGLYAQGSYRAFRYHAPRAGLRRHGVRTGTLLFEGGRAGSSYNGTAYIFSRRCGAVPYAVSGGPTANERQVMLFGVAPAGFDGACRVTHYRNDTLRFDLKKVLIPPALPPSPPVIVTPRPEPRIPYTSRAPPPPVVIPSPPTPPISINTGHGSPIPSDVFLHPVILLLGCLMALGVISYIAGNNAVSHASSSPSPDSYAPSPPSSTSPDPTPNHPQFINRISMTLDATPEPEPGTALVSAPNAPLEKIVLKLKRSQRASALGGKPTFMLDARVDLPPDDRSLIAKYRLGSLIVYDSKARQKHQEAAYGHFTDAQAGDLSLSSSARSFWKSARGIASAAMMALSLRVTINKLISGQHIECKDLDELLGAEAAVIEACRNLRTYLDTARTFDGREELLEF